MGRKICQLILVVWISLFFAGCAKDFKFPSEGATMSDIYAEHFANLKKAKPPYDIFEARKRMSRPLEDENGDLYGYTRTAENELDVLFARMPNPTLVMFIYPHLSGSNESPVPGYSTSFSMYEKVHYALPGEYPGILGYQ